MNIGFVGLGAMGLPMAQNLLAAGIPLRVFNRTPERYAALVPLGAIHARDIDELCAGVNIVLFMLLDERAVDAVMGRGTDAFGDRVRNRTWVNLGTTSPGYSQALAQDIEASGGQYVEAPVSGSSGPAAMGQLVGMMAGPPDVVETVRPLLAHLCRQVFECGPVPNALRMKLAVNHYLITMVVALAESVHAARAAGVDLDQFRQIVDAGPMSSDVSRTKLAKMVSGDFSAQAAIRDVTTIARLVMSQAQGAGVVAPMITHCASLYQDAMAGGGGDLDMAAVTDVLSRADSIAAHNATGT